MRLIKFFAHAGDTANPIEHESNPEEFDDDVTDDQLDQYASEFGVESVQIDAWWEEVEGDDVQGE